MYKTEPFSRRGSLRSLRSAPILSTVLESTLSLTRIHPIASLELPGLEYATIQSQSALTSHHRELATSLRSGIAAITASASVPGTGGHFATKSAAGAGGFTKTRLGQQLAARPETKRFRQPQQRYVNAL